MNYYIKNMVCPRCILTVQQILDSLNIPVLHIQLGLVVTKDKLSNAETSSFSNKLSAIGFELLNDAQKQIVEQIKTSIIEYIQDGPNDVTVSELLSKKLNKDYSTLSKLFSNTEGYTIEQYTIMQKIERVKEFLSYDQLTLSEIAYSMGYSSVAHLSSQFKKITGMTPTLFKQQSQDHRKPIDNL